MCPTTFPSETSPASPQIPDLLWLPFSPPPPSFSCLLLQQVAALQLNLLAPSGNLACIAAIRPFSSSIFKTPYTYTHTGVYATRAVGLKTQPTRTGFMPPVLGSGPLSKGTLRRNHTAAGFQTHLRIVTQKDPRHLFAVPTAREPTRYRVWMLGRGLKLTREHLAVAPCRRLTQFLYH